MKTHEHAIISLGYAAGVSLFAGKGFLDPWIYLTAVIGGEIIDFLDHPLYHLVYNRNEPHVRQARLLFTQGKWKEAIAYLNEIEDKREFKGLLLHNIYALTIISVVAMLSSLLLPGTLYPYIFLGSFLLHMLTDVFGDFRILGHCDNWLWVLSPEALKKLGRAGNKLVLIVIIWGGLVLLSFFLTTFRWGWQLAKQSTDGLLFDSTLMSWSVFAYIPLLFLSAYFLMILTLSFAHAHKYKIEIGPATNKSAVPLSLGSLTLAWNYLLGKNKRTKLNLERVILSMQADAGIWALIVAGIIVILLLGLTIIAGQPALWNAEWQAAFLLIPVFLALFFGTFIHTTIGEIGGVIGVLSAWLLNVLLARIGLMELWDIQFGYFLFLAAIGAWVLGLLGGIILKGQSRMSLVAFSMSICPENSDEKDTKWFNEILQSTRQGLQSGYEVAHNKIYGQNDTAKKYIGETVTDVILTPYRGIPILGEDYHHIQAEDSYMPASRELNYVLCDNRLSVQNNNKPQFGILPVMPRHRVLGNISHVDMTWDGVSYKWLSEKREVFLESASKASGEYNHNYQLGLIKTWSEIIDNILTRSSTFQTDIFVYPESDGNNSITICGVTREYTSTKEYATVESEAYAGAIVKAIREAVEKSPLISVKREASARFFYPRTSFFDQDLVNWAEGLAILPSEHSDFSRSDLSFIRKSLSSLPDKNFLPSVTANMRSKGLVLLIQYLIAGIVGFYNFDLKFGDFIRDLIGSILTK